VRQVVDRGGNSALLYAARNGHVNVLQRLVGVGANIAAVNRDGKDALDLAAGTDFTCFTGTKVQILTQKLAEIGNTVAGNVCWRMLTYADVC
jgi:hypothetical protein